MFPNTIIQKELPEKNKYFNFRNLVFKDVKTLSNREKIKIVELLQKNYYNDKTGRYTPKQDNIFPYLLQHDDNSYVSLYYINKKLVGFLSGRSVYIEIKGHKVKSYYADFLCVHKEYRKKNIAPQLIQTHQYKQSYANRNIMVSLFKKERHANYFMKLVSYHSYCFDITTWKTYLMHSSVKIIEINNSNLNILIDFVKINKIKFDCFISVSMGNLSQLLSTKNILVYCVVIDNVCYSCYFLRNITTYYDDKPVIELFTSIKNCSDNLFNYAFSNVIYSLKKKYKYIIIENISHNETILNNILIKYRYIFKEKTYFQFYNYASLPISPDKFAVVI